MNEHVSVRLGLLEKQIVDSERLPIGRVDDLELPFVESGQTLRVEAILTGAQALGERLGGGVGGWMPWLPLGFGRARRRRVRLASTLPSSPSSSRSCD